MTLDLAALYVETAAPLVAYFAPRLPPTHRHMAEDLMQTVFEKAIKAAPRFEDRGISPRGWLWQIAANLLIDYTRSRQARAETVPINTVADPEDHTWLATTDPDLEAAADRLTLDAAMASLTAEQRAVIRLWYLQGHDQNSASAALSTSPDGIRKRKLRGLRQMRKVLEAA